MTKIPQSLYMLKQHSTDSNKHDVSKLDRDFGVMESYTITHNPDTGEDICSCPSRFIPCKHVKLLKHAVGAYPEEYQQRYWHVLPHAKWIESFTAEEIADQDA